MRRQTGDRPETSGDKLKIYGFGTTKGGGVRSFWAEFLDRYAQAHDFYRRKVKNSGP